jgi:hypothetical protein
VALRTGVDWVLFEQFDGNFPAEVSERVVLVKRLLSSDQQKLHEEARLMMMELQVQPNPRY